MAEAFASARSCAYCGLPAGPKRATADAAEPVYCCYGCCLAAQIHGSGDDHGPDQTLLVRLGLAIFFAMNVMAFTMVLWTQDVYGPSVEHPLETPLQGVFRWITLFFSMPVYYLLGVPLAENCWANIKRGVYSTDLLLLLGVAAAFVVSLPSVVNDRGPVYFEVGVAVLVFVTLGRWLEARCKQQATQALDSLETLLPDVVDWDHHGDVESKPLADVRPGDLVIVRAGQRVPCDGIVERHAATIDEQLWTGENGGRVKSPGSAILAASLNLAGDLYLRATATSQEGSLARLTELIRRARQSQGHYERLADRVARVFLPLIVVVALAAALAHGLHSGIDRGILAGLAVVLIACPCALGIATPLAVWAALGARGRRGILFQSGEILERLADIRAVYFDKTGTLTEGTSVVTEFRLDGEKSVPPPLAIARAVASASHHVLSRAIVAFAEKEDTPKVSAPPVTTHAGQGLETTWPFAEGPATIRLGSPRYLEECGQFSSPAERSWLKSAMDSGHPVAGLAWDGGIRAWFQFAETVRPEAAAALAELKRRGVEVRVLTGDHQRRADLLGRSLHVPVEAELMPAGKWRLVQHGRDMYGPIAMVGDGINDGPALAGADVGIAMGCGADVARASAGVCLLGNDLTQIAAAIDFAQRTVRTIRLNLFWSVAYNIVGIGLACTGHLNPVFAALVMVVSSLFVVANSTRLASSREWGGPSPRSKSKTDTPSTPAMAGPFAEHGVG